MLRHLKTDLGVKFVTQLPMSHAEIVADIKKPGNEAKYAFVKIADMTLEIVLN